MRSYGKMVFLGGLLTREEVDGYYDKCMELARGRGDREEIYNTSARYYRDRGDYERSTAYMDSLLTHYAETGKKADLGSIYIAQSHLYEKAGDYAKALEAMRKGNDFRYHSRMNQAQSKLAEMQALYDVNRLELEKSRLADRNKLFLLVAGGIVLLLLAGWAAYQQAMVRRLKLARTQFMAASEEAQRQSRRAQESEKMKTAFINSMCHEIRTPLNAINGFSELLLTEQEPAARQAFQAEIWKSTTALTALLENMLELSQLVSSESPLPVAQTDIRLLCAERLELQKQLGDNPAVEYVNEAGTEIEIPTNAFYLTRVVDNLLHNAAKFTAAGRITLRCRNDESLAHVANQRQRHGHRHPARKAGVGVRTLHQGRPLQTRFGHRALPLPPDRHPPRGRHPRLSRIQRGLLHPHRTALLIRTAGTFASPFRRFFRPGRGL